MGKNSVYHSERGVWGKKAIRIKGNDTIHYPNKDEARLLRSIMSETGLTEEEVRSNRHYNVMLSEAARSGRKSKSDNNSGIGKFYRDLIKKACKETGLVPQHPDTLVVLQCLIDERFDRFQGYWRWSLWMHGNNNPIKAEEAVKKYAKK